MSTNEVRAFPAQTQLGVWRIALHDCFEHRPDWKIVWLTSRILVEEHKVDDALLLVIDNLYHQPKDGLHHDTARHNEPAGKHRTRVSQRATSASPAVVGAGSR